MLKITAIFKSKKYSIKPTFWLIAILLGAIQAWVNRYSLSTDDAIAYLDIGDAYLRGEWNVAINAYWSPLYSWLLGIAMFVLKPSLYWEFPLVKLINFLVYILALVCFEFFLCELIFYYRKISQSSNSFKIPEWAWVVSGYTLFIWSSLKWTGIYSDTPDMCTAALVYLASGIVLRIHTRSDNWFNFIMLGAVLGFAYLSKAAIFPISFVFLAVGMFSVGNIRLALPRGIVALLVFTLVSAPFIVTLSTARGHLTFSDTGKLNYAWLVTRGVRSYKFWQGMEPGSGSPTHSPRKIFDNPEVFEFGTPVGGTYPPWHDSPYWYEGLTSKFNLTRQIIVLARNTSFYYKQFLGSLVFSYLILVCVSGKFWSPKNLIQNWRLLIPAAAGLGVYMLVTDLQEVFIETQPSTRLIAPFIVLLFAGVFSSVRLPDSQDSKRLIAGMTITAFVLLGGDLAYQAGNDLWNELQEPEQHIQWQVADTLNQLGVYPGEKVAILNLSDDGYPYYWARLARVKIVAEIVDERSFWMTDAVVRSKLFKAIERTGARFIVQKPGLEISNFISAIDWQEIGNTGYYIYFLRK